MTDIFARGARVFGRGQDGVFWPYDVTGIDRTLRRTDPEDHARFAEVVNANIYAWIGYRLLRALRDVSPGLTRQTLHDLDEELQGGEFAEWAWSYAEEAGHEPEKWVAEYRAARNARTAEAAAASAEPAETTTAAK
jgi:hypothetical protein